MLQRRPRSFCRKSQPIVAVAWPPRRSGFATRSTAGYLTTQPCVVLRPDAERSAPHSLRPAARARPQGQRRIHRPRLPAPSPRPARATATRPHGGPGSASTRCVSLSNFGGDRMPCSKELPDSRWRDGSDRPWPRSCERKERSTSNHNLLAHTPERLHEEISNDYRDMIYAATRQEIEARRKAFLRKCGSNATPSPTASRKPATGCSPSRAFRRANGNRSAHPTRSNDCTKGSSAGLRPKPCCPAPKRPPCCSGRWSPWAR